MRCSWMAAGLCLWLGLLACNREATEPNTYGGGPDTGRSDDSGDTLADSGGDGALADLGADGPGAPVDPIRIATYNVHRLFDTVCDSSECGGDAYEALPTPEEFAAQADSIAAAILELDAEVVMLEEVETQACLDALAERLNGEFPTRILGETYGDASVDVAVLARAELVEVRRHRDQALPIAGGGTTHFARELLEVRLDTGHGRPSPDLVVFAAHFISKSSDDGPRRTAEAVGAHDIVVAAGAELPGALVVLGGDLNDFPGSTPIEALESDGALLRATSGMPADEAWTYVFNGQGQAIDHLFMAENGGGALVPGSAQVHWGPDGAGWGGSDHAALSAELGWTPR